MKSVPFTLKNIESLKTPFHLYDERAIRNNARRLYKAFSVLHNFKNYFAVKATPNPTILKILKEEGMGADCSSLPELLLAERVGIKDIMFTSNDTPEEEFRKAYALNAIINLDDISHIDFLEKAIGKLPELLCFRYNPGNMREGNVIIGKPEEAKYGLTKEQLFKAYKIARERGVKRFGLHTMVVSNELSEKYHVETASMLFSLVRELEKEIGITIEFVNVGGGYGVPYKPEEKEVSVEKVATEIKRVKDELLGTQLLSVVMESGRMITGPYGYLVTKVRHLKHTYKDYVGVDACMADLMRPGMYNAYHHITVLGKEKMVCDKKYDVTGSLCENNDKFAVDRMLPTIERDDILIIHDTGAHGYAMGFNYNGKLRSAEYLLQEDGSLLQIRRAETVEDYFATLDMK